MYLASCIGVLRYYFYNIKNPGGFNYFGCLFYSVFVLLDIVLESARAVKDVTQFGIDYTFWMNLAAIALVSYLAWLNHSWHRHNKTEMDMGGGEKLKTAAAWTAALLAAGITVYLINH